MGAAVASSLSYLTNALVALIIFVRLTGSKLTDMLLIQRSDLDAGLKTGRVVILKTRQSIQARGFLRG